MSQMERNAKKTTSLPTYRLGKECKILIVEVDRATAWCVQCDVAIQTTEQQEVAILCQNSGP